MRLRSYIIVQSKDLVSTIPMFHFKGCRSLVVPVKENIISLKELQLRKMHSKKNDSKRPRASVFEDKPF